MLRTRIGSLIAAVPIVLIVALPHPAAAVAGINVSVECNTQFQCVEAQCEASVALVEPDRQLTVVISGTATSEGPVAPAATLVRCWIQQVDPATGQPVSRGGCALRLPGAASACAAPVQNVPLDLFDVCAGGHAAFIPDGDVSTESCELLALEL